MLAYRTPALHEVYGVDPIQVDWIWDTKFRISVFVVMHGDDTPTELTC